MGNNENFYWKGAECKFTIAKTTLIPLPMPQTLLKVQRKNKKNLINTGKIS